MFGDLRTFLQRLQSDGDLVTIEAPVDPCLEAAEIHRRVVAAGGPALLFTNIGPSTGSGRRADFRLVTNLFGTARRAELAFGERPLRLAADGLAPGASRLFVRRHDMLVGPPGSGAFEGAVQHVRNFGPVLRAEVALLGGETIEIDAPRDKELRAGDRVGLEPRRYRIFAG